MNKILKNIKRLTRITFSYIHHPIGVKCLKCGLLASGNNEVDPSSRILLCCPESVVQPKIKDFRCYFNQWINFDIFPNEKDILEEVLRRRSNCNDFSRYIPGWSPNDTKNLILNKLLRKEAIFDIIIGAFLGVLLSNFSNIFTLLQKIFKF